MSAPTASSATTMIGRATWNHLAVEPEGGVAPVGIGSWSSLLTSIFWDWDASYLSVDDGGNKEVCESRTADRWRFVSANAAVDLNHLTRRVSKEQSR